MTKNPQVQKFLAKLDSKQGRQIVMALTAVLLIYGVTQMIMPARDQTNQTKQQTEGVRNTIKTAQSEYQTLLPKLQNTKIQDLGTSLNKAMPSDIGDGTNLYRLLNNLGQQVGVATPTNPIPSFQPGTPSDGTNYRTVPITLTIQGSYSNCLRFLNGLYNMVQVKKTNVKAAGPLWQVQSVNIAAQSANDATMSLSTNIYLSPAATKPQTGGGAAQ